MSRDPSKLTIFQLADELVVEVYRATSRLSGRGTIRPAGAIEARRRFGTNHIVEGCARNLERDPKPWGLRSEALG